MRGLQGRAYSSKKQSCYRYQSYGVEIPLLSMLTNSRWPAVPPHRRATADVAQLLLLLSPKHICVNDR